MVQYDLKPKVDHTQEFIEIANDFSNPLEIVREAISNSYDAKVAGRKLIIKINFDVVNIKGKSTLAIKLSDNGQGMNKEELQAFFDLGNSTKRDNPSQIGEKGHGTKVYFNSSYIRVTTVKEGIKLTAEMDDPYATLFDRRIPNVKVIEESKESLQSGTEILILGYNNNQKAKFTQEILTDYIRWYTKHGSIEIAFMDKGIFDIELYLKGLNAKEEVPIDFGHFFPTESESINKLFEKHLTKAPDYYCKKIIKNGNLKNSPEINYQAVFYIEGNKVKQSYNNMLRRPGYTAPEGSYTVQERYGLWLCKDNIPIQRKNEWITYKGSEFTKLHAFINCQGLRLTANRGSADNTPMEIISDIKEEVRKIFDEIIESDDWRNLAWLEEEAEAYRTTEKEKNDFKWRIEKIRKANICTYKNLVLVKPERESGVYSLVLQLLTIEPTLFPFQILDYDTYSGIDVIVKGSNSTPIVNSQLYYVEFKYFLSDRFNHSFENLHSIICWDTEIKHDQVISDINKEERKMQIIEPEGQNSYTKYFLDNPRKAHKIEVFVLKDYLKQKLGIDFRPRAANSIV